MDEASGGLGEEAKQCFQSGSRAGAPRSPVGSKPRMHSPPLLGIDDRYAEGAEKQETSLLRGMGKNRSLLGR
jgi:hypothetical protein